MMVDVKVGEIVDNFFILARPTTCGLETLVDFAAGNLYAHVYHA